MNYSSELVEELQANKVFFDSQSNSSARADGFRRQSILLDEITKFASQSDKYELYKAHFEDYSGEQLKAFVNDRSEKVQALLRGVPRPHLGRTLNAKEFLRDNSISLEPPCAGMYTNCTRTKVGTEDLRVFRSIPDCISSENEPETNSFTKKQAAPSHHEPRNLPPFPHQRDSDELPKETGFRTAREELILQNMKKGQFNGSSGNRTLFNYGASKKSLGARRNVRSAFVPPIKPQENTTPTAAVNPPVGDTIPSEPVNEHLQNIDPKMVELITNEIMHKFKPINWNDIAGLDYAKSTIKEAVVWPLLRPDIFTGLRRPPRGILLFGPPGTGKTLIGKCIASQSKSTFFSISASSLTSKWIGEGEKMVRALFAVAAVHQPSVIFIDEIDSLLSQRSETEHESSRRLKTEFLVQLDGANTTGDERILIVGATNRPRELDEAARRRLVRRLYIPLPELPARIQILSNLLQTVRNTLSEGDIGRIGSLTGGYSGADMENLCREASMEPIRSIPPDEIPFFDEGSVRPVTGQDFEIALSRVRATVSPEDINQYVEWDRTYGAGH